MGYLLVRQGARPIGGVLVSRRLGVALPPAIRRVVLLLVYAIYTGRHSRYLGPIGAVGAIGSRKRRRWGTVDRCRSQEVVQRHGLLLEDPPPFGRVRQGGDVVDVEAASASAVVGSIRR